MGVKTQTILQGSTERLGRRGGHTFPVAVVKSVVGVTADAAQPPPPTPLATDRSTAPAGAGFVGVCNERSILA